MEPTSHINVKKERQSNGTFKFFVRCRQKGLSIDGHLLEAKDEDSAITEFMALKRRSEESGQVRSRRSKVKDIVPLYIESESKRVLTGELKQSSFYEKEVTWRVYLLPFYGKKKMLDLSSKDLFRSFMLQEKRLKQFKNCRKVLVNFMTWASDKENGQFFDGVPKFPVNKHKKRDGRALDPSEVSKVYHAFSDQSSKDLWELLYISGGRKMEIVGLDSSRIDFFKKTILTKSEESETKTPRLIPVSDRFLEIVHRRLKDTGSRFVFPHPDSKDTPCNASYFKNRLAVALAKAGLTDIQFKDLRSTFANIIARGGFSKDLQIDYLGHSEEINRNDYLVRKVEEMRQVANAVNSREVFKVAIGDNVVQLRKR